MNAAANEDRVSARTWIAVLSSLLGAFMAVLDIQITNASLRDILGTLSATQEEGSWISTAYLVAEIMVIPLTGWLAGIFTIRRYLLINTVLFLIFSTLCGIAWNLQSMIAFRALQGMVGGVLIPMALNVTLRLLPPSKQAIGIGLFGLTATLAPTVGVTIGGILTEAWGWPSIFYINWVPGLLLIAGIAYGLDKEPINFKAAGRADWIGIACMAIGLGSLTICLEEGNTHDWFASPLIQFTAMTAIFGLLGWAITSLSRRDPFVDLRLFGQQQFFAATVIAAVTGLGLYGSSFILPLFLSQIAGYSPRQIGSVILWMGLPQLLVMPIVAVLSAKVDNRILASIGLMLFAGSCFMNTGMTAETGHDQIIWAQIVRGIGQPFIIVTLTNFATHGIAPQRLGSASSLFNMMRNLGGSVGIALLATLLTRREHFHSARIGEAISLYDPNTVARLDQLSAQLTTRGIAPADAANRAVGLIDQIVRRESFVMAYNDAFMAMGIVLALCVPMVWLSSHVRAGERGGGNAH